MKSRFSGPVGPVTFYVIETFELSPELVLQIVVVFFQVKALE